MNPSSNVQHRKTTAYWYAVGWSDATGEPDLAQEFSEFAAEKARAYYQEEVSTLRSIPDLWREFREVKP